MRILGNHGLVWLSKPKTGSTTIRRMLDPYATVSSRDSRPFYHHNSLKMALEDMREGGFDIDEFDFVVCERNPFSLIPSLWRYSKVNIAYQKFWQKEYDDDLPLLSFGDFMRDERSWTWFRDMHRLERFNKAPETISVKTFQIEQPLPMIRFLNERIGSEALPEDLPKDNASRYDEKTLSDIGDVFSDTEITTRVKGVFAASFDAFGYTSPWA